MTALARLLRSEFRILIIKGKVKIELEKCKIDGIPTLSCFKDDELQKPLIILSHALRDSKEYWQDKHFNGQRVAQFYRELKSYYREMPEKLAFIVDENAAHEFTASMWDNVTDWFQKHL